MALQASGHDQVDMATQILSQKQMNVSQQCWVAICSKISAIHDGPTWLMSTDATIVSLTAGIRVCWHQTEAIKKTGNWWESVWKTCGSWKEGWRRHTFKLGSSSWMKCFMNTLMKMALIGQMLRFQQESGIALLTSSIAWWATTNVMLDCRPMPFFVSEWVTEWDRWLSSFFITIHSAAGCQSWVNFCHSRRPLQRQSDYRLIAVDSSPVLHYLQEDVIAWSLLLSICWVTAGGYSSWSLH